MLSLVSCEASRHLDAPKASARAYTEPVAVIAVGKGWYPAQVADFVVALPASGRISEVVRLARAVQRSGLVQEVPDKNLTIVASRSQSTPAQRRPFHAVDGASVASQLKKSLSRLPDIENADDVRLGGKCGEQMSVVW